jgi:hypothetical protein
MARIELRDCDIILQDGLAGSAAVDQQADPPAAADTSLTIDTVALNGAVTTLVPIGARSRLPGKTVATPIHPSRHAPGGRWPDHADFVSALGAGNYADGGVLTFLPQRVTLKIGEGNITYTEHNEYEYLLDRGDLDTVKEGNEVPMDVKLEAVFEHITTGTSENISPMDALKAWRRGEWVSAAMTCANRTHRRAGEPHAAGRDRPRRKRTLSRLPLGAAESIQGRHDFGGGKCKATEPIVERS